jgi:8-oxo-dGTP diphosphatase
MQIHVAAAAILDTEGRVLITRRADHLHQGGLWEFPGGKLEPGESSCQALARELKEELDILPSTHEPLIRIQHTYDDRQVRLDFYRVTAFEGIPRGMQGQPLQWRDPHTLRPEDFPAADRAVITALQLPERYLITGEDPREPAGFLQHLEASLREGVRLVQLRAHGLDDTAYADLLDVALDLCRSFEAKLLINRPRSCCDWVGRADGIHLTSRQLLVLPQRPSQGLVGASCHSPGELARAEQLGLDYVLLSPVLPTASHPEAVAIGWDGFVEWVAPVNLPVYALGGMHGRMLARAKAAGGQGIAGIGAFWSEN